MTMRIALLLVVTSGAALAHDLPDDVPPPPGCVAPRIEAHDYDFSEVRGPATGAGTANLKVFGHKLSGQWQCPGKIPFVAWAELLRAKGWDVLGVNDQSLYAHIGDARYLKSTQGFELIERAEPRALSLPSPAEKPEPLTADAEPPYATMLSGLALVKREMVAKGSAEITNARTGNAFLHPPFLRLTYRIPHGSTDTLSGTEVEAAYEQALAKAGWEILHRSDGGTLIAHYTKLGRDVWLKVTPGPESSVEIGDVGAQEAQAKLAAELERVGHVAIYGLYFDTGSPTLKPESTGTLERILALLTAAPALHVEVQGHTDNSGHNPGNQLLSEARAKTVRDWLVAHGIAGERLTARGYADTQPVADNQTPEGRALNRRVELAKR